MDQVDLLIELVACGSGRLCLDMVESGWWKVFI